MKFQEFGPGSHHIREGNEPPENMVTLESGPRFYKSTRPTHKKDKKTKNSSQAGGVQEENKEGKGRKKKNKKKN